MSFSTLYTGATGLIAHGDCMQVVGNNLANVSTIGFKKADVQFGDLMSTTMATGGSRYQGGATSISQIGKGVGISQIRNIFLEGGLSETDTVTDIAITGNGFYGVRNVNSTVSAGASHYTRAGAFHFNNDAYLVDPSDYRLQGYKVDRETGDIDTTVSDIQLPYDDIVVDGEEVRVVRSDPLPTSGLEMITNLDALAADHFTSTDNPFFAMLSAYDGTQSNASAVFGGSLPAYSSSLEVYDEDGNPHDLTVYFDPVASTAMSNATPGYTYWEYLVAMPPGSDGSAAFGTSAAGLAGLGVMTFDGLGQLVNVSAFSLNTTSGASGKSLGSWEPSPFSTDGLPEFSYTYGSNGSAIGDTRTISYDFGLDSGSSSWKSGAGSAATVGINPGNLQAMNDINRDVNLTTSYDSGSATIYQNQDGYSWGYMESLSVSREGVLAGHFSNGQTEDLYYISLYTFNSDWGLRRDGSNNFLATDASGAAVDGRAGESGRGTIQQNTLEESNVDMAEEFANMIITQRGFQANSKLITTADSLLNTTINVKR
ncbi:flagellar hook-basal body complex protein [Pseudodesulfovibrio sp.]|uniref:flagellar hook protein FlgE n=1 Tax=Pseudodesulfovibrio sp. TaxID=2035812 RepID=UPI002602EF62|nr:flagellar hook-basal body complex protein [Pseudodesulfovibrio sp.]MDD3311291.1 flagellar hook-basal body complex protein [Pseudodesulfovibrio sp.]